MATKCRMDAHIHSVHTKKVLLCGMCNFNTYNLDSLQQHKSTAKNVWNFILEVLFAMSWASKRIKKVCWLQFTAYVMDVL